MNKIIPQLTLAAFVLVVTFLCTRPFITDSEAIGVLIFYIITTIMLLFSYELHYTKSDARLLCQMVICSNVAGAVLMAWMDKYQLIPLLLCKVWFDLLFWKYVSSLERTDAE